MNSKKRAIASHQMDVGVCLLLVHLSEAGEELMEVLRGCRIAVSRFGPVYEGHVGGAGNVHDSSKVGAKLHYSMVFVVCQEVESLLRISTLNSNS